MSSFCMGWKVYFSIFRVYSLLSLHEQNLAPIIPKEKVVVDRSVVLTVLFY